MEGNSYISSTRKPEIDWVSARLFESAGQKGPIVLMYHGIHADGENPTTEWSLSLKNFKAHLDLIADAGWVTATGSTLLSSKELKPRTLIITFDDGYANNFAAYEALKYREMTATWFIVSDTVGKHANWGDPSFDGLAMLSAEQLREMRSAGMEIGSHGKTHSNLAHLDDETLRAELELSRTQLGEILGETVHLLAYPSGRYNEKVLKLASAAQYKLGFSCHAGHALANFQPMLVKRLAIYRQDNAAVFARKLAFADNRANWSDVGRYGFRRLHAKTRSLFSR